MPNDKNEAIPPKPKAKKAKDAPLTREELADTVDMVVMRPLQTAALTSLKQGLGILDGWLGAMAEGEKKKKATPRKKK